MATIFRKNWTFGEYQPVLMIGDVPWPAGGISTTVIGSERHGTASLRAGAETLHARLVAMTTPMNPF